MVHYCYNENTYLWRTKCVNWWIEIGDTILRWNTSQQLSWPSLSFWIQKKKSSDYDQYSWIIWSNQNSRLAITRMGSIQRRFLLQSKLFILMFGLCLCHVTMALSLSLEPKCQMHWSRQAFVWIKNCFHLLAISRPTLIWQPLVRLPPRSLSM